MDLSEHEKALSHSGKGEWENAKIVRMWMMAWPLGFMHFSIARRVIFPTPGSGTKKQTSPVPAVNLEGGMGDACCRAA